MNTKKTNKKFLDKARNPKSCTCDDCKGVWHTCPYKEDVRGDCESTCNCCPYCTKQCARDI